MPNHITTVLTVRGTNEAIARFVAGHILPTDDEERRERFDFNTVIPQPESLKGTESGTHADIGFYALTGMVPLPFPASFGSMIADQAKQLGFTFGRMTQHDEFAEWLREHKPEIIAKGEASLRAFRETGCRDWYEWNVAHWGTKWNAYDFARREAGDGFLVVRFETAWSVPRPVLARLSEMHPALSFEIESIDEGGPEYKGAYFGGHETFTQEKHDIARYRRVYGREPYSDEEESDATN